jgi:hypothetical protein
MNLAGQCGCRPGSIGVGLEEFDGFADCTRWSDARAVQQRVTVVVWLGEQQFINQGGLDALCGERVAEQSLLVACLAIGQTQHTYPTATSGSKEIHRRAEDERLVQWSIQMLLKSQFQRHGENGGTSVRSRRATGCQWARQLERPLRTLESSLLARVVQFVIQ